MAGQSVIISVLAQTQQFSKGMKSASDTANSTFKKVAGLIAGAFSIAVVTAWAKDVADQFMQLEDDLGNIGVQMGSKTAQHFNDSFAGKLAGIGLSKVEATSLGSMLSTTFEKAGLSGKQLESTIVRVRDISGATGQDNTTIARAWEAAERGKYAAMEKTLGLSKGTMKTLVEEKMKRDHLSEAEARHAVLMQQTHKMQGEAKKDADTLGGQLEIAKAMWSNMGQAIAEKVMPYVIQFGKWITGTAVPKLQEFGTYIQNILGPALEGLGKWIQDNTTWLAPLGVAIGVIVAAFVAWQSALAIWSAITTAATAIQGAFNAILLMLHRVWRIVRYPYSDKAP